ncbi:MAG TPA: gamma-glutamyl-gamma-aminobutyrate hydrolase family protein [Azospirillaceae bacterium]|nr:gamma-glutamyl-gamma-aminobutyrate hydrolase family protein [Azospirillaceae bacterium]
MKKVNSMPTALPLVGIPADHRMMGHHPFHVAGDKYIRAVSEGAGALPMIVPALGDWYDPEALVARLDGLLFTGSPSNVHPTHYQGAPSAEGTLHDRERDATTLPLLKAAIAADLPVLCICRGFQELNVALGGTLHQRVQELPGMMDHREDYDAPVETQYAPVHAVSLTPGGRLARITGRTQLTVNSLHQQGIDRLAPGLVVEATAPDGLIEAVRVEKSSFALGFQWHPEWRFWENAPMAAVLTAFGDAVRARAERRTRMVTAA